MLLLKMEDIWLVGKYLPVFPESSNLPSYSEVFRKFMFHLRAEKQSASQSAHSTTKALKESWIKKHLNGLMEDRTVEFKVLRYYNSWRVLQKGSLRTSATDTEKRKKFSDSLRNLFDIGKKQKPRNKVEKQALKYLQEQREQANIQAEREPGPTETISCSDFEEEQVSPGATNEPGLTETQKSEPGDSEQEEKSLNQGTVLTTSDFESSSQNETQSESVISIGTTREDFQTPGPSKPSPSAKPKLKKVITVEVAAALDRCKVSDRNAVFLISSIAKSLGHDVSTLLLNKESIRISRKEIRKEKQIELKTSFKPQVNLTVHWDSKLLPSILPSKAIPKSERLAIVVSGEGIRKLLAVPHIQNSTGVEQAEAVYNAVVDWDLENRIMFTSFDTTASNTGRKKGACQHLDKMFKRKLIGLPCRHHIYELLVGKAFKVLQFETTQSPNVEIFKRFQTEWYCLEKSSYHSGMNDAFVKTSIAKNERKILLTFFERQLKEQHHREDYREVIQLAIIFLGGTIEGNLQIRAPGAFHNARWMAKIIYSLKMFIYRHAFALPKTTKDQLARFNVFIVTIYLKNWFLSSCAAMSANNDLNLLKLLKNYEAVDEEVAKSVQKGFLTHLQYLDSTLIGLCLFDDNLVLEDKKKVIQAFSFPDTQKIVPAKSIVESNDVSKIELHMFVQGSKDIKSLFQALEIPESLLDIDVTQWNSSIEYQNAKRRIQCLEVVNDNAERGIALIKTYNSKLSTDEDQKQCMLQLVEEHRNMYKSPKKSDVI